MRSFAIVLLLAVICALPAHSANDSSCEISVAPAATLLLPYFEVDVAHPAAPARTTIFTITNVSAQPQIAHVTLWTDWGAAIAGFNVTLTPYGIQSINLADVFARGLLPQTSIPRSALDNLRQIFTTGVHSMCTSRVGGVHANAIGYATVDVVATLTRNFPGPAYFTSDILFDNVLIGDYAIVDRGVEAAGSPMVHIRAVPEGGPAGSNVATNLPFTFYDHFTLATARSIDRRQPLPAVFGAHWLQNYRESAFTTYVIWREGFTGAPSTSCAVAVNSAIPLAELVRFDEHENSNSVNHQCYILCIPYDPYVLPETSSLSTSSFLFPGLTPSGDQAGWMYLNLNSAKNPGTRASQNWVSIWMSGNASRVLFDAAQLGNGCSPAVQEGKTVGPLPRP